MKLIGAIFFLIGVILVTVFAFIYHAKQRYLAKALTAPGTIIELRESRSSKGGTTYYPIVEFAREDGKKSQFSSRYSSNPPAYEVGQAVEVYYEADKPAQAEIKGFFSQWLGAIITGAIGMIFTGIGTFLLLTVHKATTRGKWLMTHGCKIETQFQAVVENSAVSMNGRSPFVIYSQWLNPQTRQVHVFKSESLWYDPSEYITNRNIPVWVDPNDYENYRVDLSFLPESSP